MSEKKNLLFSEEKDRENAGNLAPLYKEISDFFQVIPDIPQNLPVVTGKRTRKTSKNSTQIEICTGNTTVSLRRRSPMA